MSENLYRMPHGGGVARAGETVEKTQEAADKDAEHVQYIATRIAEAALPYFEEASATSDRFWAKLNLSACLCTLLLGIMIGLVAFPEFHAYMKGFGL
jgi:hypothetical protein